MKTITRMDTTCIPDGDEFETDRVRTDDGVVFSKGVGPPRYRVTLWYDDGTSETRSATAEDIQKYRRIMGQIDSGAPLL